MKLSFIIPALNEQDSIPNTIRSIYRHSPPTFAFEVIVADHGSHDQTAAVATQAGAEVIQPRTTTIAGLRNAGAHIANGDVFIFLDADVQLTAEWGARAEDMLPRLARRPDVISGSRVLPPVADQK